MVRVGNVDYGRYGAGIRGTVGDITNMRDMRISLASKRAIVRNFFSGRTIIRTMRDVKFAIS